MEKNKTKIIKIFAGLTVLLVVVVAVFISIPLIKTLKNPEIFRDYIESFGSIAPLVFILLCMSQILVPIIPGEPMELVAGYAFGGLEGTVLCLLAESIASIIVILLVKKYGRKLVIFFFDENKLDSIKFLHNEKRNQLLITILFLMPGTPKDLLCYFIGLTDIDIKTLIVISSLCRLPSITTSTLIGGGLSNQNYVLSIIVFILTTILSLLGILLFNRLKNKHNKKEI